jgi:opacity protein-like surface antigen
MKRAWMAVLVAAALLGPAAAARAEKAVIPETVRMMEPHLLRIGDYVRAWPTTPEGSTIEGHIVGESATTLTITGADHAELVSLPTLGRLEVRHSHNHTTKGALIGAAVGLVASAFVISRELLGHEVGTWERIGWTAAFTAGGAGAGAIIGHYTTTTRWQQVDLVTLRPQPPRTDLRGGASPRGVRLAWTVRF